MDAGALAADIVERMARRGLTASTAESCTGGQLAAAFTSVPGSSAVFIGGIVAYASSVKAALLQVPDALLERYSAVSGECAEAMAAGCQHGFATDFALSTTGIAGPGGAMPGKPVGLVYFGWARRGRPVRVERMQFSGDRAAVQRQSVEHALRVLQSMLDEL
jgi:nicotinamide-nucleotide amidase